MARKKRSRKKEGFFDDLAPQTKQAIGAVAFFVLGIFFVLSSLGFAGIAGDFTHRSLNFLFGLGFVLAPAICALYIYVLLKPREDERTSISKIIGVTLLFISLLGLLALLQPKAGGVIGAALKTPFEMFFGAIASATILVAFSIVAVFLTFNIGLGLPNFLKKKEFEEEDEEDYDELSADDELKEDDGESDEEEGEEEEDVEEKPQKKSMGQRLGFAGNANFVVSSFQGPYDPPPLTLLQKDGSKPRSGDIKASSNTIKRTLQKFKIDVEMDEVTIGPSVTRYALKPAEGVKLERIVGLQTNLEYALAASPIRIEAPIPGKSLVGIEVPNSQKQKIGLASIFTSPEFTDSPQPLLTALGRDIGGGSHFANIARMPHALIAGTTGSGKSVAIHNLVVSLLYRNSPEQLRFIMVDPKRVELTLYNGIPHLLSPVITDPKKTILALKWAAKEMDRRLDVLQQSKVQNLAAYHEEIYQPRKKELEDGDLDEDEEIPEPLPYIVIVIDELADLMSTYPRELEALIVRLAQMSRAVGIHLILSTQRPSVNVITGTIKANIPTRIALQVASQIDSRTILDQGGAEKLLGKGDMLFLSAEHPKPARLQSAFVTTDEVKRVVDYLKKQDSVQELDAINLDGDGQKDPDAFFGSMVDDDEDDDDLYEDAKETVLEAGKASTSYLQRKLRVGYSRAARLMDLLEERGIIGAADGSKAREILVESDEDDTQDE